MKTKEEKLKYSRDYYSKNSEKCKSYSKKYQALNKEVKSAREKIRYENNKDYFRSKSIKKLYGDNANEIVNELYKKQVGCCAICGVNENDLPLKNGRKQRLHIDHCHSTGKIRGLLCSSHNLALGGFGDNIILLESAKQYLLNNG